MENAKYIAFYALLLVAIILGAMNWSWLVIFPFALILTGGFIAVKGKDWRKLMGEAEMNAVVVLVATYLSQLVLSAILFGLGRLVGMLFN